MQCQINGKKTEMFKDYSIKDDIAMLENLLTQIVDLVGETDATAYDESTETDWGTGDVLVYLQTKYRKFIYGGGELKGPEQW